MAHKESIVRALPADWTWSGKGVLDFGCGVGRILRHFTTEARETKVFAACDIDGPSIAWLSEHYGDTFDVRHTGELPPLPWPDATFDLAYAGSVFTHLADSWAAWLVELHRLLAPGGLAFITLISGAFAERQTGEPWDEDRTGMNVLFWGQDWEHWGPAVLHSEWWVRSHWGRAFEILHFAADGLTATASDPHHGQGWVLLRRRPVVITREELEALDPAEVREWEALRHNLRQVQYEASHLRSEYLQLRSALDAERRTGAERLETERRAGIERLEAEQRAAAERLEMERSARVQAEHAFDRLRQLRSVRAALRVSHLVASARARFP